MRFLQLSIILLLLIACSNTETPKEENIMETQKTKPMKMDIQYAYTILYVSDVPKTMEFYKNAFGFEQKFLTPENDYGEVISGSTTIAFVNLELANSNLKNGFIQSKSSEKPFGIELAFTTSKVEQVMQNAAKYGATIIEELVTKPWGQEVGYIRDINGFLIEICTPIQSQE